MIILAIVGAAAIGGWVSAKIHSNYVASKQEQKPHLIKKK